MGLDFFEMSSSDDVFSWFKWSANTLAICVWLLTLVTQNFSQMDRLWPILPVIYSWSFLYTSMSYNKDSSVGIKTSIRTDAFSASVERLFLISALITAWGIRLFAAFWRRGYYEWHHTDHRWPVVMKRFSSKWTMHLFNFIFMGFGQNWILLGYVLPMWYIQTHENTISPLNKFDYLCALVCLISFVIEAVADEQQWAFQSEKHKWLKSVETSNATNVEIEHFKRGFCTTGLFKYSRHPNYLGDLFFWWSIYSFTLTAQLNEGTLSLTNPWSLVNYSMGATLFMTGLFHRSANLTEMISAKKYPEYVEYKKQVGRIIPTSLSGYSPTSTKKSN